MNKFQVNVDNGYRLYVKGERTGQEFIDIWKEINNTITDPTTGDMIIRMKQHGWEIEVKNLNDYEEMIYNVNL